MNEVPFKNLAAAKDEYIKLAEEFAAVKEQLVRVEALEALNSDLKTQLETTQKSCLEGTAQIASAESLLKTKDEEIKQLKTTFDLLNMKCLELEKNQKSVKAQARELVAASAGAPAPVDNSDLEMTENDIVRAMRSETDTKKLNALYRQFKTQRAASK